MKKRQRAPAARPKDGRSGEGECSTPDTPGRVTRCPPLGALLLSPQHAKPACKGMGTGVGDEPPRPHPWLSRKGDRAPRVPAQRTGSWGREGAQPWTSLTQAPGAPSRGPSCCCHSAESTLARACAVGLVTGPAPAPPTPRTKCQRSPAARPRAGGWGGESAQARTSLTEARSAPPWMPSCRLESAKCPPARACAVALMKGPQGRIPHAQQK